MDSITPWAATCGLLCIWPMLCVGIGFLWGSRRFRSPIVLRNPLRRDRDDDVIGYGKGR